MSAALGHASSLRSVWQSLHWRMHNRRDGPYSASTSLPCHPAMLSHFPIDAANFSLEHASEVELEPFRSGRLLVLALVLTMAACTAGWLVEDARLGQIIDGTFNDAPALEHTSA